MNPTRIKQIRETYETAKTFIGLPEAAGYSAHYWNDVPNLLQEIEHLHNELEVWKSATKTASSTIDSLRQKQEIAQLNLNQEKVYKSVSTLENFLRDHQNGEFTWDEVTNVFGPNDATVLVNAIKIKDEILTRYMRIEQDLMDDCNQYEQTVFRYREALETIQRMTGYQRTMGGIATPHDVETIARQALEVDK